MRVLFLAPPVLASHLYVQVPMIWALRNAGHEVLVAAHPDLADTVQAAGLPSVTVGHDMLDTLGRVDQDEPVHVRRAPDAPAHAQQEYAADAPAEELTYLSERFLRHLCTEDLVDDLVEFGAAWAVDLIVWDQLCYAGGIAATALGVPHARMLFGTDGVAQLCSQVDQEYDTLRAWIEPALQRHGAAWHPRTAQADLSLDTMPPWTWRPDGPTYAPLRHLPYNGSAAVPMWAVQRPKRPRVAVTGGLSHAASGVAHSSVADLLAAFDSLDAEIVATADAEAVADLTIPDNVRIVDFVPINALLPTCAAVVHHGGSGTFAAAYEHGVPQLVIPSVYWSDRWFGPVAQVRGLEEEGAGMLVADSDALEAALLRSCLDEVLGDPQYGENAARLQKIYAEVPGPAERVKTLEDLVAKRR